MLLCIVFTEIGKKNPTGLFDISKAVEMSNNDLASGAQFIVVEKSEIVLCIQKKSSHIHKLIEEIGHKNIRIEVDQVMIDLK